MVSVLTSWKVLLVTLFIGTISANPLEISTAVTDPNALPLCSQALANLPNTATLQSVRCLVPSANETSSLSATSTGINKRANGPYCSNGGSLPATNDAKALCSQIPSYIAIGAISSDSCVCETWIYGTAAWATCNCDKCAEFAPSTLKVYCSVALNDCILPGYTHGYYAQENPNIFMSLYRNGDSDESQVGVDCN